MSFINDDFMLQNEMAKKLYHNYAKDMPIIDYHCHLSQKEIFENKTYRNITEIWLGGDHYKWRAMRTFGVVEKDITGDTDDRTKFQKWADTVPNTIGNPLYHWTHLELKRFFGIDKLLNSQTAEEIWNECNEKLKNITSNTLIKQSNVRMIGTTDDPIDDLEFHKKIKSSGILPDTRVLPSFRPDKGLNIERDTFLPWLGKLKECTGIDVKSYDNMVEALYKRIDYFNEVGCKASDHALDVVRFGVPSSKAELDGILKKAIAGQPVTEEELSKYQGSLLVDLAAKYRKLGWVMQLHIGALRNNSNRMYRNLGADTGFDSINDMVFAQKLSALLNAMDDKDNLPKTVLYCLNPRDNEVLGTMCGNFQGGGIKGKIQFGSGWWFNDQKDGMIRQMVALSNLGLISCFVGMLTDSRSFLSFTRHEYFRRILCDYLGDLVVKGEAPNDEKLLGEIVKNICYNNAKGYFEL